MPMMIPAREKQLEILWSAKILLIDAAFKLAPKSFHQTLNIITAGIAMDGLEYIQVAHMSMKCRSVGQYQLAMVQLVAGGHRRPLRVETIVLDFEEAEGNVDFYINCALEGFHGNLGVFVTH